MKYDEIKKGQLVTDNEEETINVANLLLKSIVSYVENSHTQSPLARYHNLVVVLEQVDEIYHQTHIAALDYLREKEMSNFTAISHETIEKQAKKATFVEKDGVRYQLLQSANFRNLATKDSVLNSLIISEKQTNAAKERIEAKIMKRIGELRATKEFKKAKPTTVSEVINLRFNV